MNLHNQVCSLELAKKLKELGVKQESFLYWADGEIVSTLDLDILLENGNVRSLSSVNNLWPDQNVFDLYSAFTVAELGAYLPQYIEPSEGKVNSIWLSINDEEYKVNDDFLSYSVIRPRRYHVGYSAPKDIALFCSFAEEKEADARAKMLIWLIEKDLVKP